MLFLSAKLAWFIHLSCGSQMGKIKKTSFIYNQFLYSRKILSAFAYKKMLKCTWLVIILTKIMCIWLSGLTAEAVRAIFYFFPHSVKCWSWLLELSELHLPLETQSTLGVDYFGCQNCYVFLLIYCTCQMYTAHYAFLLVNHRRWLQQLLFLD